jgi:hypothetical protein
MVVTSEYLFLDFGMGKRGLNGGTVAFLVDDGPCGWVCILQGGLWVG